MRGYATYTDKHHNGLSYDILENKWGIGIDKANKTL